MKLRYMIIGAGGVGGPVGAYLSKSGADTTLIARGKHLAVLQEHGLTLVSGENERESIPVKAIDMDGFLAAREQGAPAPDVIFVCVKGYSLADTVPFIPRYRNPDLRLSEEQNTLAMDEYIEALEVRQVCHQLVALFGQQDCAGRHSEAGSDLPYRVRTAEPQDRSSGAAAGRD